MSFFARIEEACAGFIERAFARTFPADIEPAHIARKLVATMEAKTLHENDRATAPSHYVVAVHPSDFERLAPHQEYLEREWAALLADMGGRVNLVFEGPVEVRLAAEDAVQSGLAQISTGALDESAAVPKSYVLRMLRGVPPDATFVVRARTTVGRGKQNDVVLSDPRVSREHARIETEGRTPMIFDLDSTNGTFIDGERIRGRSHLRTGDVLTFGNTQLVLEESSQA